MREMSLYEHLGILLPGSLLLFGLTVLVPEFSEYRPTTETELGGFGLFVIFAYVTGHVAAAFGNLLEKVYWFPWGGMPSNWVIGSKPRILTAVQINQIPELFERRFNRGIGSLVNITKEDWQPCWDQIYRAILVDGTPRVEAFLSNYGLHRGLASATIFVAAVAVFEKQLTCPTALLLTVALAVFLFRMHRFGVSLAREVLLLFLNRRSS